MSRVCRIHAELLGRWVFFEVKKKRLVVPDRQILNL